MVTMLRKLCFVNFALLMLYAVSSYYEWTIVESLPYVYSVLWTPLHIQMVTSSTSTFDPVATDRNVFRYNLSFWVLLALVAVNLAAVWKTEHGKA